MNYDELLREKESILKGTCSKDVIDSIYKLHKKLFNIEFNKGCRSCYADCFLKIYNYKKSKSMECDYRLKAGAVVITNRTGSITVTNVTMTNDSAESILKENKGLIDMFDKFPIDWEYRCGLLQRETIEDAEENISEIIEDVEVIAEKKVKRKRK